MLGDYEQGELLCFALLPCYLSRLLGAHTIICVAHMSATICLVWHPRPLAFVSRPRVLPWHTYLLGKAQASQDLQNLSLPAHASLSGPGLQRLESRPQQG